MVGGVLARAMARVATRRTGWTTTRSFIVRPANICSTALPLRVTASRELRLICGAFGVRAPAGGVRWMSEGGEAKKQTKAELQEETVFLRLTGSVEAHTVKINKEQRYLVALEATMKILEKDLIKVRRVPPPLTQLRFATSLVPLTPLSCARRTSHVVAWIAEIPRMLGTRAHHSLTRDCGEVGRGWGSRRVGRDDSWRWRC